MAEAEIILTEDGKQDLLDELHFLETEKRAEVGERIKVAREFGDISENSEYDDAKNEQAMMEGRIAEINRILQEAKVVAGGKKGSKINIGNTVKVDMGGKEREFTIVGGAESNVAAGKISNLSPVGQAILGSKKGDTVTSVGPNGRKTEIKILSFK